MIKANTSTIPSLLLCLMTLSLFGLYSCQESSPEFKSKNKLEQKHGPADEFFIQRAGPDGKFAIEAYSKALNQVKTQAKSRSIGGFDLDWETQGPGNIGARINTVAVHPTDENIIYAGFSAGGVFKTTNGGLDWEPIFDEQVFLSIGAIVLDPQNPDIVYVGTGDPNISGFPFIGDGLYRSMDAGQSWTKLGLEEQRIISKVVIDPSNSSKIFAACMGLPFARNNERGLYRSEDNGNTWQQILFVSDSTGITDLVIDPDNPQVLFAAAWDRIRNNRESLISGTGAKVYKSTDGGDSWTIVEAGLPSDMPHSRIGLAICESNPDVIYVQYIHPENYLLEGIYRTDDGGDSWFEIPTDDATGLSSFSMGGFGWYFGKIRVNPKDENDIYLLGVDIWRTRNAGQTWDRAAPAWWSYEVHADKHDLVFLQDGGVLLGTDGGLYKSDADNTIWEDIENIPTTQFYRVAYNPFLPEYYYGGAQDNGSTGGNADDINSWERIYGGDGFQMAFDEENPERFFVETQNGNINMTTDGGYSFTTGDDGIDNSDRRNWDMPYFISSFSSNILYAGTQRVYQGIGEIPTWTAISEDLTDGDIDGNLYHNITAIDESSLDQGLLYVGTGDGNLWRGEDGGTNWTSISNNLPDQYVTSVVASPSDTNTVYVTYSGYRDNDFIPRIHRSTDRGESWEDISNNLPDIAINDVTILSEYSDSILFVATDGGVFGSNTAGTEWERLGANMPIVPVYDILINPVTNELVAGTFARSIMSYPLDSISTPDDIVVVNTSKPKSIVPQGIKVYPTVATDFVQVEVKNTEPGKRIEWVVISLSGQVMHQSSNAVNEDVSEQLDISNFPAGQYFVKAKNRHKVMSGVFMKM